jgi:hypothetical protein
MFLDDFVNSHWRTFVNMTCLVYWATFVNNGLNPVEEELWKLACHHSLFHRNALLEKCTFWIDE